MHANADAKDNVPIFSGPDTLDKASIGSEDVSLVFTDHLESEFLRSMRSHISKYPLTDEINIDWNIIESLGKFLGIHDFKTHLFSCWVLRTLIRHVKPISNEIDENDYKTFMYWILEELAVIRDNPSITRKQFFELTNAIFHRALLEIIDEKYLPYPSKFFRRYLTNVECMESFSPTTLMENKSIGSWTNADTGEEEISDIATEPNHMVHYYEKLLHFIVDATYEIFGSQVDYMLIRSTLKNQDNVLLYTMSYYYQKPKVVKKSEAFGKSIISIAPRANEELKKKKRKSFKSDVIPLTSITNGTTSGDQHHFILPLCEALESNDVLMSLDEIKEYEVETVKL